MEAGFATALCSWVQDLSRRAYFGFEHSSTYAANNSTKSRRNFCKLTSWISANKPSSFYSTVINRKLICAVLQSWLPILYVNLRHVAMKERECVADNYERTFRKLKQPVVRNAQINIVRFAAKGMSMSRRKKMKRPWLLLFTWKRGSIGFHTKFTTLLMEQAQCFDSWLLFTSLQLRLQFFFGIHKSHRSWLLNQK